MNVPDSSTIGDGAPAPSRTGGAGRVALVVVLLAALAILVGEILPGSPETDARERRITEMEAAWRDRLARAGESEIYRTAATQLDAWEGARRPGDARSWRLRYRSATVTRPPDPPRGLTGAYDSSRAAIVLRWTSPEDADGVTVLRSRREDEAAGELAKLYLPAGSWEDELFELRGTYAYRIRSWRGELTSARTGPVTVTFRVDLRLRLLAVDRLKQTARIEIGPAPDGPRPRLFLARTFPAERGKVVGTQVETGFDYNTGYVLTRIFERHSEEIRATEVPVFTPEGTRARDARGRPLFARKPFPRILVKLWVRLERGDEPPLDLVLDE